MKTYNIYLEGKSDISFLSYFLIYKFDFTLKSSTNKSTELTKQEIKVKLQDYSTSVNCSGGIDTEKIATVIKEIILDKEEGNEGIIIMDTDTERHSSPRGGFTERSNFLKKLIGDNEVKYFLIPNNSDDGNIETLLQEIVGTKGKDYYSHLENYVDNLNKFKDDNYPKYIEPNSNLEKLKIMWYSYIMHSPKGDECPPTDLWDLDSNKLDGIYEFLKKVFE